MNKDLKDKVSLFQSLTPAARAASANGSSANLQGYESSMAIVECGVLTDGTHTPKLQESSDNSTFTDVAAGDQLGSLVACTGSSVQKVGYRGILQYLRVVMTVAGATTGAVTSAVIVGGHASQNPAA